MKIRCGFVSNSSSSSFIIKKQALTKDQIMKIKNHRKITKLNSTNEEWNNFLEDCRFKNQYFEEEDLQCHPCDEWTIEENDQFLKGYTTIDNFDMEKYLEEFVGIPLDSEIIQFTC